MAFVPDYTYDIFVSYSSLDDNQILPSSRQGWVKTFVHHLQPLLDRYLFCRSACTFWIDTTNLHGNYPITDEIVNAVSRSATLLVFLSTRYLNSAWCQRERNTFLHEVDRRVRAGTSVFVVKLEDVPIPKEFGDKHGYTFYIFNGEYTRLLGLPDIARDQDEYHDRQEKLSRNLAEELKNLKNALIPVESSVVEENPQTIISTPSDNTSVKLIRDFSGSQENSEKKEEDRLVSSTGDSNRQKWLKQLKFKLDPFEYPDGAHDPNLARYFYRRPEFPEILGNASKLEPVLVFGVPGSGKSSLRNVIAQICRTENILPVVYDNLKPLLDGRGNFAIHVEQHVEQILKVALEILAMQIEKQSSPLQQADPENSTIKLLRKRLWAYISKYEDDSIRKQLWKTFLKQNKKISSEDLPAEPQKLLDNFCQCITTLFLYERVYFLVDPDEDILPDPNLVWRLLQPLLNDFSVLALHSKKATFKFFLNLQFRSLALQIPWLSCEQSRGIYRTYILQWSQEDLRELLKERLRLCSDKEPAYTNIAEFSDKVEDADNLIVQHAEGKPRKLITICNMLFNIHANAFIDQSNQDHLLITRQEIEETFQQLTITEPDPTAELIAQGENMQIEFKSTMRWNLSVVSFKPSQTFKNKIPNEIWDGLKPLEHKEFKEEKDFLHAVEQKIGKEQSIQYQEPILKCLNIGKRDKEMDKTVAKTLCGFMNHEGGTLIIGVNDHGEPVGLEYDFNTLEKKDEDGFERAFHDLLKIYLEIEHRQNILDLSFKNYHGNQICVVEVEKSQKPVYCLEEDEHKFYVRRGNATQRLDVKSAVEYIQDHFEK